MPYVVDKLAIHLVDKNKFKSAQLSKSAQDVKNFPQKAQDFLNKHVEKMCTCEEGNKTRPGYFVDGSDVKIWYEHLLANPGDFLQISQDLAKRLFLVSPVTASPGLLMVLLFRTEDTSRQYLGLFKLDPFDEYMIKLRSPTTDLFTLDVEEILEALPEADSERVLKCAMVRHPSRVDCDVKFRDYQNAQEPAQYFQDFLGCQVRSTGRTQIRDVFMSIDKIDRYAKEHNLVTTWPQRAPTFIEELIRQPEPITFDTLVRTTQKAEIFPGLNEKDLRKRLSESIKPDEVYLYRGFVSNSRMAYYLPNGIAIKGPTAVIKSMVNVHPLNGGYEFQVSCAGKYKVTYE